VSDVPQLSGDLKYYYYWGWNDGMGTTECRLGDLDGKEKAGNVKHSF